MSQMSTEQIIDTATEALLNGDQTTLSVLAATQVVKAATQLASAPIDDIDEALVDYFKTSDPTTRAAWESVVRATKAVQAIAEETGLSLVGVTL